jgi:hypothetical protein
MHSRPEIAERQLQPGQTLREPDHGQVVTQPSMEASLRFETGSERSEPHTPNINQVQMSRTERRPGKAVIGASAVLLTLQRGFSE